LFGVREFGIDSRLCQCGGLLTELGCRSDVAPADVGRNKCFSCITSGYNKRLGIPTVLSGEHPMSIDRSELLALPIEEKLELVALLWDDLGNDSSPLPIPDWAIAQAKQRQNDMKADPACGVSQQEMWRRVVEHRNG